MDSEVKTNSPGQSGYIALRHDAQVAERAQDWNAAVRYWSALRDIAPDDRAAVIGLGGALLRLQRLDEAEAEFQNAPKAFFDHLDFLINRALSADDRGDQDASLIRWAEIRERFPDFSYAHAAVAAIYFARDDAARAEEIIAPALKQFPANPDLLANATMTAISLNHWEDAESRFNKLLIALPDHPYVATHGEHLKATISRGLLETRPSRLHRDALAAESRGEWRVAYELWEELNKAGTAPRDSLLGMGRMAREAGDFADAEAILTRAMETYPTDAEVFANYAQISSNALEWNEAARRWREGLSRFPELDVCCNLYGDVFRRIGALADAERLTSEALKKYPDRMDIRILHVTIAQDDGRWDDAVARWDAITQLAPNDLVIRDARGRAIWHAGLQDPEHGASQRTVSNQTVADVSATENEPERLKLLMQMFQGLGDNCEFGMVQRHFGAEPLGLFRFSGIYPHAVADLLADEFNRLGDPDHTRLHESASGSFLVEDDRGYYRMHTFLKRDDIDPEKLLAQQLKRIKFLKRELIEDLRSEEKILVCKETEQRISDDTLHTLSERLGAYGRNLLVGIRLADEKNPPGSVEYLSNDILVGYVAAMYTEVASSLGTIDFVSWQKILETAYNYKISMSEKPLTKAEAS